MKTNYEIGVDLLLNKYLNLTDDEEKIINLIPEDVFKEVFEEYINFCVDVDKTDLIDMTLDRYIGNLALEVLSDFNLIFDYCFDNYTLYISYEDDYYKYCGESIIRYIKLNDTISKINQIHPIQYKLSKFNDE